LDLEIEKSLTTIILAITYLVFGATVFGDGGELFTPKPQV